LEQLGPSLFFVSTPFALRYAYQAMRGQVARRVAVVAFGLAVIEGLLFVFLLVASWWGMYYFLNR
jgi:hypothetical protein